jgi:hypothetical protein
MFVTKIAAVVMAPMHECMTTSRQVVEQLGTMQKQLAQGYKLTSDEIMKFTPEIMTLTQSQNVLSHLASTCDFFHSGDQEGRTMRADNLLKSHCSRYYNYNYYFSHFQIYLSEKNANL